jgi:hypothetical protein
MHQFGAYPHPASSHQFSASDAAAQQSPRHTRQFQSDIPTTKGRGKIKLPEKNDKSTE